jgi:hypothetical protein
MSIDPCEEFGHHCGRCDGRNIREAQPIYCAMVDEVPSLSLTPHEISDPVTPEVIVAMWDALKKKYEEQKTRLAATKERRTWTQYKAEEVNRLEAENENLRGLLAKGLGACVYCQLPAEDISKCQSGFPGCARMDDIVCAKETEIEVRWMNQNAQLIKEIGEARSSLQVLETRFRDLEMEYTNVKVELRSIKEAARGQR